MHCSQQSTLVKRQSTRQAVYYSMSQRSYKAQTLCHIGRWACLCTSLLMLHDFDFHSFFHFFRNQAEIIMKKPIHLWICGPIQLTGRPKQRDSSCLHVVIECQDNLKVNRNRFIFWSKTEGCTDIQVIRIHVIYKITQQFARYVFLFLYSSTVW